MNAGLGNLTELKAQLLAEALRVDTGYDAVLLAIGRGVAGQFDTFCNRKLARAEGDTYTVTADREQYYLPRYPVESVSQVELKTDEATGWVVQADDIILTKNPASGMVYLGSAYGPYYAHIRFTYTGGYWFDETEENNDTLPTGATALPADVKLAWILQCRAVWQSIDKLGTDILKTGSSAAQAAASVSGLDLVSAVEKALQKHIRYAMT